MNIVCKATAARQRLGILLHLAQRAGGDCLLGLVSQAIATIQAIRTGWVHPTLNQDNLVPEVDGLNTVPNEKQQHDITAALSNSFGFGGHNSVVAFGAWSE